MEFKNKEAEELWEKGLKNNDDPYGSCIYKFAKEWAELMETEIANGKNIKDMADKASRTIDQKPGFGITGFMYGAAVQTLAHTWKHGFELMLWHNKDTADEEQGTAATQIGQVINPAILTVKQ